MYINIRNKTSEYVCIKSIFDLRDPWSVDQQVSCFRSAASILENWPAAVYFSRRPAQYRKNKQYSRISYVPIILSSELCNITSME